MSEPITVTIERLAFGGDGVGRLPSGKIVFIPDAFPGDTVTVALTREQKRFARARVLDLQEPSAARVEPACPVADACGGCCFWRLEPERAWAFKRDAALEAIARLSRLPLPDAIDTIDAPSASRYRRRLRLHLDEEGQLGFFAAASHTVVPLSDCLVAHPTLVAAAHQLTPHIKALGPAELTLDLDAAAPERAVATLQPQRDVRRAGLREALQAAVAAGPHLAGIRLTPTQGHPGDQGELRVGDLTFRVEVGGHAHRLEAGVFTQANDGVNALLQARVLADMEVQPGEAVLELYSGWGNLSFGLAAAGAHVRGFEVSPLSVRLGMDNARRLLGGASGSLNLSVRDLSRGLPGKHAQAGRYPKVLLDPPRDGAAAALPGLLTLAPGRIVYVSCAPATLGRDLGRLGQAGYRLTRLALLNMFPRTAHVEAIAVIERG